jgi:LysM repeat protein
MNLKLPAALIILLLPVLFSCRSSRHLAKTTPAVQAAPNEDSYILAYRDIAVSEMKRTGIPASITLAQGMIESDYGRSTLAREANNHFGIKCHSDWTGSKVYHHDDHRNECFRKYGSAEESFQDHSEFLRTGSRYKFLFDLSSSDYRSWAHGLKKAGYATNPDYANMLIRTIEEKGLQYYDNGYKPGTFRSSVPSASNTNPNSSNSQGSATASTTPSVAAPPVTSPATTAKPQVTVRDSDRAAMTPSPVNEKYAVVALAPRVLENNRLRYIIVKDGDTREGIEEEFQLLRWELARFNDLPGDFRLSPGQMLYLQAKRDKAEAGKEYYDTTEGDTMHMISQKYGIRLRTLYKMNRMIEPQEPVPGTRIWLRAEKPLN